MDSTNIYLKIKKSDVYLLCPYFEAFEGMVAVRTPQPPTDDHAILKLMVSPSFQDDIEQLLTAVQRRFEIERVVGKL